MSVNDNNVNIIIIDGSYYCFYRFHALINWWNKSHKDEPLDIPHENTEFMNKFDKLFVEKIKEIPKKLKINKEEYKIIVAKDCPRSEIWRNKSINNYKGNRDNFKHDIGPFFKTAYEKLFNESGIHGIVSENKLEADDCVALIVNHYIKNNINNNIYIISYDMDYLQLLKNDKINMYNLKYQNLRENKAFIDKNPSKSLFCKILMGDKSDNIKPIFSKCGIKTALKYYDNKESFDELLMHNKKIKENYETNKKLIDFDEIPTELSDSFYQNNNNLILF